MGLRVSTELDASGVVKGSAAVKRSLSDVDAAMSKTEKQSGKMGQALQGVGYQFSDLIVQIQAGQNPMIAVTQQGSQLIGAFNPMAGLFFTAAGALGTALLPALFNSKSAMEELEGATDRLSETLTIGEDGVITYTDKIARLAEVSEQAARVQIAASIADATEIIRSSATIVDEVIEGYEGWFTNINAVSGQLESLAAISTRTGESQIDILTRVGDTYEGNVANIGVLSDFVDDLGSKLGTSAEQSLRLASAFSNFERTPQGMVNLADTVATLAEETGFSNSELNKLAKSLQDAAADGTIAQSAIDLLNKTLKNTGVVVEQNTETFRRNSDSVLALSQQLLVLNTEYNDGARAAQILAAQQRAGVDAGSAQGQQIALLTGQIYDLNAAMDARTEREKAQRQTALDTAKFEEDLFKAEQKRREQLSKQVDQIAFGTLSPVEQLREEERLKLEVLAEYAELGAEQEKRAQELRTSVQKQGTMERNELARIEQQNTVGAISGGFDALSQLSSAFIGDQDNQNKTAFALSKGFAAASAALNLTLALSQALADPAALTLPQKLANYAAVASAGAGLVQTISSAKYATGGFVEGGGTGTSDSINARLSRGEFVVRESVTRRNRSALESLNSTGQMPSGGVNVYVENYGNNSVTASADSNGDIRVIVGEELRKQGPAIVAGEMGNPSSKSRTALARTSNLKRN